MHATQSIPDADFTPAEAGTRVRLATLLSVVIVVLVTAALFASMLQRHRPSPRLFAFVGVVLVIMAVTWFAARIRRYRLVADAVRIEFPFRTVVCQLAGLVSVSPDRDAMRGAWKVIGNDGLGAVTGHFRSKHLGTFRAYLTDAEHAVVLRWPDRCLVISPHQHSYFVEMVRKRAGLSS
jgi:Bacterial PH domain